MTNPKPSISPNSKIQEARPSYSTGVIIIITAIVFEVVGRLLVGSMQAAAKAKPISGIKAMGDYVAVMNDLQKILFFIDLGMVLLVVLGIFLMVRVYLARRKGTNP